jgi:hypothetical protein
LQPEPDNLVKVRESRKRRDKLQLHLASHKRLKLTAAKQPTIDSRCSANNGSYKPGDRPLKKKAPAPQQHHIGQTCIKQQAG